MKTLKYLFYDNFHDINTKELKICSFRFNNKTKVKELYGELRRNFYPGEEYGIEFIIVDNINNNKIGIENLDANIISVLNNCHLDNTVIIYSVLPVGGTGAIYKGYRIYINSNELKHKHVPHAHVEYGGFLTTRINLITLEIMNKDIFCNRKDKKKILGYLEKNQEKWIGYYNSIVVDGIDPGMKIEKII